MHYWDKALFAIVRNHLKTMMEQMDTTLRDAREHPEWNDDDLRTFVEWKRLVLTWRREIEEHLDRVVNAGEAVPLARQHCQSCDAPVYWLKNDVTGKPAPIDVDWAANGNIAILPDGHYKVYSAKMLEQARPRTPLHTNHFVTCPQRDAWKHHGGSEMRGKK